MILKIGQLSKFVSSRWLFFYIFFLLFTLVNHFLSVNFLALWAHRIFRDWSFLKVQPPGNSADSTTLDSHTNDADLNSPTLSSRKRFAFYNYPIPPQLFYWHFYSNLWFWFIFHFPAFIPLLPLVHPPILKHLHLQQVYPKMRMETIPFITILCIHGTIFYLQHVETQ